MTAPTPTARERELAAKIHDDTTGRNWDGWPKPYSSYESIAEDLRAYRESILLEFEALAKEWSAQIDWSAKYTPESRAAHGVQACRNDLEVVIAKLRGSDG